MRQHRVLTSHPHGSRYARRRSESRHIASTRRFDALRETCSKLLAERLQSAEPAAPLAPGRSADGRARFQDAWPRGPIDTFRMKPMNLADFKNALADTDEAAASGRETTRPVWFVPEGDT